MSALNWQNLRPLNGSQHSAFEELCCQLAGSEPAPAGARFVRKAPPDAGVECYWRTPSGDEWAWQAKFFTSTPGPVQWRQIDDSVKTALDKHPRMTSLTVCLPIDRADPKMQEQQWFMDRWNRHVGEWSRLAAKKGMSAEFHYWGQHELVERLSREEHAGRSLFWFDETFLSNNWLGDRLSAAVANAGPRYSPELQVHLPIARAFDGFGRTREFAAHLLEFCDRIMISASKARLDAGVGLLGSDYDELKKLVNNLTNQIRGCQDFPTDHIPLLEMAELADRAQDLAWNCEDKLRKGSVSSSSSAAGRRDNASTGLATAARNENERLQSESYYLYKLWQEISAFQKFITSDEARLANVQGMLLVGSAGTGKTHLFCDVAKRRTAAGLPTLLLFGSCFRDAEPFGQMIRELGLTCSTDAFLGALEAAAQTVGARALILIDALNESNVKTMWTKYLGGMLTILSRYPWIGIGASIRTSYEPIVIPEQLVPERLYRLSHSGFAGHEYDAVRVFFGHYGLKLPSIPLLSPEFQNPLFLKLFCAGLREQGRTEMPTGFLGILEVFRLFLEGISDRLSRPDQLDFDPGQRPVLNATRELTRSMADRHTRWLPRAEAQRTVDSFLPGRTYDRSLFRSMVAEGILVEDILWTRTTTSCEGVRFAYERFSDHQIVGHLLDRHLNVTDPAAAFAPSASPLADITKDEF